MFRRSMRWAALLSLIAVTAGCQGVARPTREQHLLRRETEPVGFVRILDTERERIRQLTFIRFAERRQVPIPTEGLALREALLEGYGAGALHTYDSRDANNGYHSLFVIVRRGPVHQYLPIGLIERHELGHVNMTSGEGLVLLKREDLLATGFRYFDVLASGIQKAEGETPDPPLGGSFRASGLIRNPGTFPLSGQDALENQLKSYFQRLDLLSSDPDPQAASPVADVAIVHRVEEGVVKQFFIPLFESGTYAGDTLIPYGNLQQMILQDGDHVEFTKLSLLPVVLEARIRSNVERQVEEHRHLLQRHRERVERGDVEHGPVVERLGRMTNQITRPLRNLPTPTLRR